MLVETTKTPACEELVKIERQASAKAKNLYKKAETKMHTHIVQKLPMCQKKLCQSAHAWISKDEQMASNAG